MFSHLLSSARALLVTSAVFAVEVKPIPPPGVAIPDDWKPGETEPHRLDFWLRSRAEKATELGFIADRLKNKGEFTLSSRRWKTRASTTISTRAG